MYTVLGDLLLDFRLTREQKISNLCILKHISKRMHVGNYYEELRTICSAYLPLLGAKCSIQVFHDQDLPRIKLHIYPNH